MGIAERRISSSIQPETTSLLFSIPQQDNPLRHFDLEISGTLPIEARQLDSISYKRFLEKNSRVRCEEYEDNEVEIAGFIPYERIVSDRGIRKKVSGNLLQTTRFGDLLITQPTQQLRLRQKPFLLGDAQNLLSRRENRKEISSYSPITQYTEISMTNSQADHQHVEALLAAGWSHIAQSLYTEQVQSDQLATFREVFLSDYKLIFDQQSSPNHGFGAREWLQHQERPSSIPLQEGIESNLSQIYPSCGSADLVCEGPDRLFSIDVGSIKKFKVKQTIKQQLGLTQLLKDNNVIAQPDDISTYIAPYFRDLDSPRNPLYVVNLIPISESLMR